MKMLACDIDNTLMHSIAQYREGDICIEIINNRESGFISPQALALFEKVFNKTVFVPVTTRSLEQYQRILLFQTHVPRYAITSNGGMLLHENSIDYEWLSQMTQITSLNKKEMEQIYDLLSHDSRCCSLKVIDDIFVFTRSEEPKEIVKMINNKLVANHFNVFSHKKKIYMIPNGIDKGRAVEYLMNKLKCDYLFCAGDSDIDLPMLNLSDCAFTSSKEIYKNIICDEKHYCPDTEMDFATYFLDRIINAMKV